MAGNTAAKRRLALIGAPTSAGAYAPGQEKAPAAFREHGIVDALRRAGWDVRDAGDAEEFRWRTDPDRLVYIDLDTDLNALAASDGALDWTGVAHLLDLEGTAEELSSIGTRRPMLTGDDILFVAAGNITPSERATIQERCMRVIDLEEVHRDPGAAARKAVVWGVRFDRLLVHVDVDVLSFTSFPIAENVRRQDGLTLLELGTILQELLAARNWATLTVTEVNPDHAPVQESTFTELITMLQRAFAAAVDATTRENETGA